MEQEQTNKKTLYKKHVCLPLAIFIDVFFVAVSAFCVVITWEWSDSLYHKVNVVITVVLGLGIIMIFLITSYVFLPIVQMDEDGIKCSLYKIFRKRDIKWDEVEHISFSVQGYLTYIFVSKKNMSGKSMPRRRWDKDTVTLILSKEALITLRMFTQAPIENVTKEQEESYLLNTK